MSAGKTINRRKHHITRPAAANRQSAGSAKGAGKYIFFIGGSGARACRAFLHSCASGAIRDDAVRIMLLDADTGNAACTECEELYQLYQHQYEMFYKMSHDRKKNRSTTPAFHCKVTMYHGKAVSPVEAGNRRLKLVVPGQHENGRKALEWFYEEKEREQDLLNGFYAHPNIGCIFFQNFSMQHSESHSPEEANAMFKNCLADIVNDLRVGDVQIAIVGSLFGGTGAAGIPTVLNVVKDYCEANAAQNLSRLHFGGVLIAPYFQVPPKPSDAGHQSANISVESDTFLSTTRSALRYYQFQDVFDKVYLIGKEQLDIICPNYEDGGSEQRNKAHIVELLAVMAAKDFLTGGEICKDPQDKIQILILKPMMNDDDLRNRFDWYSDCFDRDFWALADMLRAQILLESEIYPYVETKENGSPGMYQWYKAYEMSSYNLEQEDDDLSVMRRFSEDYLDWMYDLQYRYKSFESDEMEWNPEVALCGEVLGDMREQIAERTENMEEDELERDQEARSEDILSRFNTVVETAQNMGYVAEKAFLLLSALGVVPQPLAAMQLSGLFKHLFDLVRDKRETR